MNKLNIPAAPTPMHGDRAMISQAEFSKFQQTLTSFSTKLSSLTIDVKTDSAKMNEIKKEITDLKNLVKELSNDISNIAHAFKTYIGGNN